jgi:hypothetical protein
MHRVNVLHSRTIRLSALATVAAATLAPISAAAQEAPTLAVSIDAACDAHGQSGAMLGDALLARLPDLRLANTDATYVLTWTPQAAGCELKLVGDQFTESIVVSPIADADEVDRAAARIAWWIATAAPIDPVPEPQTALEGSGDVGAQTATLNTGAADDSGEAELLHRPFVLSFSPRMYVPARPDVPFSLGFGLHVLGSPEASLRGFEAALIGNLLRGDGQGAQVATTFNHVSGNFDGVQFAPVNVAAGTVRGAQVGVVSVATGELVGAQFAMVNVAAHVEGAQVGQINIADDVDLQVGLINYARTANASIGLLSIVRDQPVYFNVGATELGRVQLGVRHGSPIVQNSFEVELTPTAPELVTVGYGLGVHFGRSWLAGELDLVTRAHFDAGRNDETLYRGTQQQLRATGVFRLLDRFAYFAGVSYNLLYAPNDRVDRTVGWSHEYDLPSDDDNRLIGWAGFHTGLRF